MNNDLPSVTGLPAVGRLVRAVTGTAKFKQFGLVPRHENPPILFGDVDLNDATDGVAFGIGFNPRQHCAPGSRLGVEAGEAKDTDKALTVTWHVLAGRLWAVKTLAEGPEIPIRGPEQIASDREADIYGIEENTRVKSGLVEIGKRNHWIR